VAERETPAIPGVISLTISHSAHNVLRLNLGENQSGQNGDEETGKHLSVSLDPIQLTFTHLVLERCKIIAELEESKRDDQSNGDVGEKAGPLVVGVSPQGNICYHELADCQEWFHSLRLRTVFSWNMNEVAY
jgi:hypothetical protein